MRSSFVKTCVVAATFAATLIAAAESQAMWVRYSMPELVASSPLIVVGAVKQIATVVPVAGGSPRNVAILEIERVLKGDPSLQLVQVEVPQPDASVSSATVIHAVGDAGLWFLHPLDPPLDAIQAADHPQRYVPSALAAGKIAEVEALVAD